MTANRQANATSGAPPATGAGVGPRIGFWSWAASLTVGAVAVGMATAGLANVRGAPPIATSSISPTDPQPSPGNTLPALAPQTAATITVQPSAIVIAKYNASVVAGDTNGAVIDGDTDGAPPAYRSTAHASGAILVPDLEMKLGLTVQDVEGRLAGRSSADVQGAVKTALEDFIIQSGAAPMQVREALEALLLECRDTFRARDIDKFRACPGNPQSLQTIEELLKVVVASIDAQEAPGAGGAPGLSIFGATPPSPLGAGGSNYQPR